MWWPTNVIVNRSPVYINRAGEWCYKRDATNYAISARQCVGRSVQVVRQDTQATYILRERLDILHNGAPVWIASYQSSVSEDGYAYYDPTQSYMVFASRSWATGRYWEHVEDWQRFYYNSNREMGPTFSIGPHYSGLEWWDFNPSGLTVGQTRDMNARGSNRGTTYSQYAASKKCVMTILPFDGWVGGGSAAGAYTPSGSAAGNRHFGWRRMQLNGHVTWSESPVLNYIANDELGTAAQQRGASVFSFTPYSGDYDFSRWVIWWSEANGKWYCSQGADILPSATACVYTGPDGYETPAGTYTLNHQTTTEPVSTYPASFVTSAVTYLPSPKPATARARYIGQPAPYDAVPAKFTQPLYAAQVLRWPRKT